MKTSDEKISVIIPVYNVEQFLCECLDSVINQTYTNLEIIVVNDGSIDNSGSICDDYAVKDSRMIVVHNKNAGLSSALNCGLRIASGHYIAFIDSDDWVETDLYQYALANLLETNTDIAVWPYINVWEKTMTSDYIPEQFVLSSDEALAHLIENSWMKNYHWNKLFKKELFDGVNYPDGENFEDVPVTYKLFLKSSQIVILNEAKSFYRRRRNGITGASNYYDLLSWLSGQRERYIELLHSHPNLEDMMLMKYGETFSLVLQKRNSLSERVLAESETKFNIELDFAKIHEDKLGIPPLKGRLYESFN